MAEPIMRNGCPVDRIAGQRKGHLPGNPSSCAFKPPYSSGKPLRSSNAFRPENERPTGGTARKREKKGRINSRASPSRKNLSKRDHETTATTKGVADARGPRMVEFWKNKGGKKRAPHRLIGVRFTTRRSAGGGDWRIEKKEWLISRVIANDRRDGGDDSRKGSRPNMSFSKRV